MTHRPQPSPGHPQASARLAPGWSHSRRIVLRRLRVLLEAALREALAGSSPAPSVLDLGCGTQPYRPLVEACGAAYLGADMHRAGDIDIEVAADGSVPLADHSVDVILSTQVLEHVEDPRSYLRECRRLLKDGGRLVVSTHGIWRYHPDPLDLWRWTGPGLRRLLELEGYEVVWLRGDVGMPGVVLQLGQDTLLRLLPKPLAAPIAGVVQGAMAALEKLAGDRDHDEEALNFVVLARRCESRL